jgi:hypothetical protein
VFPSFEAQRVAAAKANASAETGPQRGGTPAKERPAKAYRDMTMAEKLNAFGHR